jgi:hypothetical protein
MAVASQAAVPGDVLYPVKRVIESAQVSLKADDGDKATALLDLADRRLGETRQLIIHGAPAANVNSALQDVEDHTAKAADLTFADHRATGDTAGMNRLSSFTHRAIADLTSLSPLVATDSRPALMSAVQALRNTQAATLDACPTCETATTVPQLVSNLSPLLTGETDDLRSLARLAEELADETPTRDGELPTDLPTEGPTTSAPTAPDGSSPSPLPPVESPSLKDIDPTLVDTTKELINPVNTLLDELTSGLDELNQKALDDWEKAVQEWREARD